MDPKTTSCHCCNTAMAGNTTNRRLRIAIIGGGLAGATLANALFDQPHLDIHIFESAPEFSERGAAVGLAVNAQRALAEIIPSANALLDRAGAVPMNSTRVVIVCAFICSSSCPIGQCGMVLTGEKGSGAEAGTTVFDFADKDQGRVVHRAALLRELLAPLRPEIMSTSKKLVDIVPVDAVLGGGLELRFQDGSIERADALIGADGIFGFVRKYVLGANDATMEPVYAGWWDCRNLVPIEKAKEKLGEGYFVENSQYGWVGDGGFIMHDVLNSGETVQCVGACREEGAPNERKMELDRDKLEKSFAPWLDGPIAKGMIDVSPLHHATFANLHHSTVDD